MTITEEQIDALIEHCKRQKKSFSRLIKEEHSDTLECLDELLYLRKSMKWHDLRKNPDDLPTKLDIVLITTDNGCYGTAYLHGVKKAYIDFGNIIAWMGLPQFKEEK